VKREALEQAIAAALPPTVHRGLAVPLALLVERLTTTPVGVTAVRDAEQAVERHVLDALRGLPAVDAAPDGALADVGSGGGIPGLVLALARPGRAVHLIEATRRKATFLAETAEALGVAVTVHPERAETLAAGPCRDRFACVCARALATPPVAAELCLPLTATGGRVVLWVGREADPAPVASVAERMGGALRTHADGLLVLDKRAPTPPAFPRRPGMAAKRPLAP
jgi:16S rRNA (guanine527-N7)-methyltransferase